MTDIVIEASQIEVDDLMQLPVQTTTDAIQRLVGSYQNGLGVSIRAPWCVNTGLPS